MKKTLRVYQEAAEKSLFKYLFENKGNPLVVAPVAAGKSLMIAEFIRKLHDLYPRCRIVMLTHVKELLVQNHDELTGQYSDADIGFYCAGLGQKRLHNDITFASIQSIHNKISAFNRVPEIIIIDEAHLISHKAQTQYRKFIDSVMALNPNCRVIGYTGSPFRADTGRLDEGKNKLFDDVAYEIGMDYMIDQGYWAKPVCPEVAFHMSGAGIGTSGGEYVAKQIEEMYNTDDVNEKTVVDLKGKIGSLNRGLGFCATIQHANDVCEMLNHHGISAKAVTSENETAENKAILAAHKAGEFKLLVNVAKLTTGYNDPYIDFIVYWRPIKSPVLYIQTIGRGVRTVYADGYDLNTQQGRLDAIANSVKPYCTVFDYGGVVEELGAVDTVTIEKKWDGEKEGEGGGQAVTKICPSCGTECAASQRYCYSCSYCFIDLTREAGNNAIVSSDEPPEWVDVMSMWVDVHKKKDSPDSLKVTYATMRAAIREWVCYGHHIFEVGNNKRYAWDKAYQWHMDRLPDIPVPKSATEASEIPYPTPSKIKVKREGKYWRILDYEWGSMEEPEEDYEIPF